MQKKKQECASDCSTEPNWFELLGHSRSLFIYHAGQRLNSTRYFFAIYGVIFAGYITVLKETGIDQVKPYALAAIAFFGFFVAVVYYLLDMRNAELVSIDENAMHYVERQILENIDTKQYPDLTDFPNEKLMGLYQNSHLDALNISKAMDAAPLSAKGISYGNVMTVVFFIASIVPAVALVYHIICGIISKTS